MECSNKLPKGSSKNSANRIPNYSETNSSFLYIIEILNASLASLETHGFTSLPMEEPTFSEFVGIGIRY